MLAEDYNVDNVILLVSGIGNARVNHSGKFCIFGLKQKVSPYHSTPALNIFKNTSNYTSHTKIPNSCPPNKNIPHPWPAVYISFICSCHIYSCWNLWKYFFWLETKFRLKTSHRINKKHLCIYIRSCKITHRTKISILELQFSNSTNDFVKKATFLLVPHAYRRNIYQLIMLPTKILID